MRNINIFSFTNAGKKTGDRIAEVFRSDSTWTVHAERIGSLKDAVAPIFKQGNALVFVGAVGIAMRAVAPLLKSKLADPPVIVVDDSGRYVIPILSGHVGGANRLAEFIATKIGATPVITTATDIRGVFAVDVFAAENGYTIIDPEMIKVVSSRLLEGKAVGLSSEFDVVGPLPENVFFADDGAIGIHIGLNATTNPFDKTLHLMPKCFHVGVGCKRGVMFEDLHDFFIDVLKSSSVPVEAVVSLSSIDLKKNENAVVLLAERYGIPFLTYSEEQLREYERYFEASEFVRSKTGVGNVCEISASLSSKHGKIVRNKIVRSGMTLSISCENWQVRFERDEQKESEE